jgi:hypothetical protein
LSLIGSISSISAPVQKLFNASSIPTVVSTPSAPPAPTTAELAAAALKKDMAELLKVLSSGNLAQAKVELAQVTADLKTQKAQDPSTSSDSTTGGSTTNSATAGEANSPASALDTLVTSMTASLASGGTSGALQDLKSYLIQSGEGSGNLLDAAA